MTHNAIVLAVVVICYAATLYMIGLCSNHILSLFGSHSIW